MTEFINAFGLWITIIGGIIGIWMFAESRKYKQLKPPATFFLIIALIALMDFIYVQVVPSQRNSSSVTNPSYTSTLSNNTTPTVGINSTTEPTLTPSPTPSPTAVPTERPTPPPIPIMASPSNFSGSLRQDSQNTTFDVSLNINHKNTDGSFQGKWYALINGTNEDVFVDGLIIPFNQSGNYSQLEGQRITQIEQEVGSNGLLLYFTSTAYDQGTDIWLHGTYYALLRTDGSVQGIWYAPDNSEQDSFRLHS